MHGPAVDVKEGIPLHDTYFKETLRILIHVFDWLYFTQCPTFPLSSYIYLSEVCLEEKEEHKNYLRIPPECFNELYVLVKDDITK